MSQIEKLIQKLRRKSKDFKYSELVRVMNHFGYCEDTGGNTSGSAIKFVDDDGNVLYLHKPHGQSGDRLFLYQIDDAQKHLTKRKLI